MIQKTYMNALRWLTPIEFSDFLQSKSSVYLIIVVNVIKSFYNID